jgi:hypothetical protein
MMFHTLIDNCSVLIFRQFWQLSEVGRTPARLRVAAETSRR